MDSAAMNIKDWASIFKTPLDKLLSFIGAEVQQVFSNRLWEYQHEEYKRNYYAKTILHRTEPKPLHEFYQPLYIRKLNDEKATKKVSTQSAKKLFNNRDYITLLGSAGSGKSTIIKHLFVNCYEEGYKIPIKIELRYLNEFKGNINDYIFNEIFRFQKLGFSPAIIDRLLDSDSFVFFFDGYDEISSNIKAQTTKDIDSFVTKYPTNKYIITSRPYTNIEVLPLFENFEVCELEDDEIEEFVRKQIRHEENEIAVKIIQAINKEENYDYWTFLSNPLLLSMFILTFQSYSDIPQKRSEFYRQVFDTLFSVHDSVSKLAYVRERLSGVTKDQFEEILRLFSFLSFFEEKFVFPPSYLADKLAVIKSKKPHLSFDTDLFIEDLQIAIGILNKEGLDYTFPHRSLQEYFAASYIEKIGVENKQKIYSKLKQDIYKNEELIFFKEHFFDLLCEIDYSNCSRFLSIPLIQEVNEKLKTIKVIDKDVANEFYGRITNVFYKFLHVKYKRKEINAGISSNDVRIYKSNESFPNPDDLFRILTQKINFPPMIELVSHFQQYGDTIVEKLIKRIDDIDKSDEDIINLI